MKKEAMTLVLRKPVVARLVLGGLVLGGLVLGGRAARSDATAGPAKGVAAVYGKIPADQAETLVTGDRIKAVAASGSMTAIWETLEFGEKVECLDCIPAVEPLLYNTNPRTREIAAWWLRRRTFGVFGAGQAYSRVVATLAGDADSLRRANAASALGEFLDAAGVQPCATAVRKDADPGVRAAAAAALGRLNDDGAGAIVAALADGDEGVRLAALGSAARINGTTDAAALARLLGDPSARVRRRALEVLDAAKAKDAVSAVTTLAQGDPDADVRGAACHALGSFGDASAQAALQSVAATDANGLVRDQAKIALRRL